MSSSPKLSYEVRERCVITVDGKSSPGRVIATFDTPYAIETQYIILLDDVQRPQFEVRDALRMSPDLDEPMPSGDKRPATSKLS